MIRPALKKIFLLILSIAIMAPIYGCVGSTGSKSKPEFVYENGIKRKCLMWGANNKCVHIVPLEGSMLHFKTN